jgi:hypothetical protein
MIGGDKMIASSTQLRDYANRYKVGFSFLRIEKDVGNGRFKGPATGGASINSYGSKWITDKHPCASDDFGVFPMGWLIGVKDINQLFHWFTQFELYMLYDQGFKLVEYWVSDYREGRSGKQACFSPRAVASRQEVFISKGPNGFFITANPKLALFTKQLDFVSSL